MIGSIFRRHPVLVGSLGLATAIALFFAARFLVSVVYWSAHHDAPIRPWMTMGYIGRSYHLNPRALDDAAGLPGPDGHPLTLARIAEQRGVPVDEIIRQVEAAIAELRAAKP